MAFQGDSIYWVEVDKIVPNPFQPRREFDEQKLRELSDSVRMYGILQPLTVTRKEIEREDGTFYTEYELIAGERRLRASKLAGLTQVPVIIREGEDSEQEKLELAIIENLQREDLNAVDRALAFRQLADVFGLSHAQVAKKVGRSREYVSNSIRLLALPDYMLSALRQAELSEGHARTLLMLNDRPEEQDVVFREILLKKLSVREVERIVRKIATDKVRKKDPNNFDTELIEMEKQFMETLGTRVQIQKTDYGGRLTIDYFSVEDLEVMLTRMKADGIEMKHSPAPKSQLETLIANTPLAAAAAPLVAEPAHDETTVALMAERRVDELMNESDEALMTAEPRAEEVREIVPGLDMSSVLPLQAEMVTLPDTMPEAAIEEVSAATAAMPTDSPEQAYPEEVPSLATMSEEAMSEILTTETLPEEVLPAPAAPMVATEEVPAEDESDLYSIRHFSV
jgi:ParB family transcriptional regulator, chromosome partitioning protein